MTSKKLIYINSANRTSGSIEDFIITKQHSEFNANITGVKLLTASVPYSWDNVVAGIELDIEEDGIGTFTMDLDDGFYDGNVLAQLMADALNNLGTLVYTVEFLSTVNQLVITSTGDFRIIVNNEASAAFFGLPIGPTPAVGFATEITTGSTQLLSNIEIFICSDLIGGSDNGVIEWVGTTPAYDPDNFQILARIPVSSCHNKMLQYSAHPESPIFSAIQSNYNINRSMRFFLKLPNGQTVYLYGYNWSAELLITFD